MYIFCGIYIIFSGMCSSYVTLVVLQVVKFNFHFLFRIGRIRGKQPSLARNFTAITTRSFVSLFSIFFLFTPILLTPGVVPFSLRISPEGNLPNGDDKSKLAHQQTYRYMVIHTHVFMDILHCFSF